MTIKAIAFDIDGTLYPNSALMSLQSVQFIINNAYLLHHFSRVRKNIRTIEPIKDFYALQIDLLSQYMHISIEKAQHIIKEVIYEKSLSLLHRNMLIPTIIPLLETLRNQGFYLATLSDFPVAKKLHLFHLTSYFDIAFCSEECGYLKPHPKPFIELCNRLQLPPQSILYVGNSYHYDILGAHSAGLYTAHFTKKAPPQSRAHFSFSSYHDLQNWIQENNQPEEHI